jgi:hypothetical protein
MTGEGASGRAEVVVVWVSAVGSAAVARATVARARARATVRVAGLGAASRAGSVTVSARELVWSPTCYGR